ncbi:acyltransferase family protein [Siminovitchia acidinfaciens]|nr:acyltransferase family protein [Siminovitchia acidinfaciens]
MIKEWNLLRAVACLSIVFLHSTTQTSRIVGHLQNDFYSLGRILLCFATPTFIVLSIIILANRYSNKMPDNFWKKRIKFILIPFISFGIIDALVSKYFNENILIWEKILENIFTGNFVGWFILVIFQLYALHHLVVHFKLAMRWFLPTSLLLMFSYLYMINSGLVNLGDYSHMNKLPIIAWLGYFSFAFIIGKHYSRISLFLFRYRWWTLLLVAISLIIVYFSYEAGIRGVHSRRLDLFPLVFSISSAILAWGQLIPNNNLINIISNYSFGIYLIHWQYQRIFATYISNLFSSYLANVTVLFVISLLASIFTVKLISVIPFGSFIVGKIKKRKLLQGNIKKRIDQNGELAG